MRPTPFARCCAHWIHGILYRGVLAIAPPNVRVLALVLVLACIGAKPPNPLTPMTIPDAPIMGVSGPVGYAPGDSLAYTIRCASPRAVSCTVTVTASATNGTWTGLPTAAAMPSPGFAATFTAIAIPWDSATFTATGTATNAAGTSGTGSVSWRVKRKPGVPIFTVDSGATILNLRVEPNPVFLPAGGTRQLCPLITFVNGAVALLTSYQTVCDSVYQRTIPTSQRTVTVAQQMCADFGDGYCFGVTTGFRLRRVDALFYVLRAGKASGPYSVTVQVGNPPPVRWRAREPVYVARTFTPTPWTPLAPTLLPLPGVRSL